MLHVLPMYGIFQLTYDYYYGLDMDSRYGQRKFMSICTEAASSLCKHVFSCLSIDTYDTLFEHYWNEPSLLLPFRHPHESLLRQSISTVFCPPSSLPRLKVILASMARLDH